jgi:hypothetical protein
LGDFPAHVLVPLDIELEAVGLAIGTFERDREAGEAVHLTEDFDFLCGSGFEPEGLYLGEDIGGLLGGGGVGSGGGGKLGGAGPVLAGEALGEVLAEIKRAGKPEDGLLWGGGFRRWCGCGRRGLAWDFHGQRLRCSSDGGVGFGLGLALGFKTLRGEKEEQSGAGGQGSGDDDGGSRTT